MTWQKPSAKFCEGGACAEVCDSSACVEVSWMRPCESAHCVEMTDTGSGVLLRASGEPGTIVSLTRKEFSAFIQAIKAGEYDEYVS